MNPKQTCHCRGRWPGRRFSWPASAFLVRQVFFGPNTITAYFPTATSIYPGDEVRVSGVKVGKIDSIKPEGTQTKMILEGRSRRARFRPTPRR